jgi:hypothetical protein
MTTTKNWDLLNRLTQTSSVPSASSAVNFNYRYNANQRAQVNLADCTFSVYRHEPDYTGTKIDDSQDKFHKAMSPRNDLSSQPT